MGEVARCRWDREESRYVTADGEECDQPKTSHCGARRSCGIHLGWGELTCARCVGRVRQDVRQIVDRAALMLTEAIAAGVNSEAANLAGPAADVEAWSWRKVAAKQGRAWHLSQLEDDDEQHPYSVLARWAQMLTEDYDHERPEQWTIANAAAYLDRHLHTVAQAEEQDFQLLAREMRKCRQHLEAVMCDSLAAERGVPCPDCGDEDKFARLEREYSHWCEDPECCRVHVTDDSEDVWVCPREPAEHRWTHRDYENRLEERKSA